VDRLLTPKQVARAIGVSESSLKRWCDQGLIPTIRTNGGHRRLPLAGVMQYLRDARQSLVDPEVLGLPRTTGAGPRVVERAEPRLRDALIAGDEETSRQIVLDLYLAGQRVAPICDEVVARAFHRIGGLWDCGDLEVFQERRGCEICFRVLQELLTWMPRPPVTAPLAIGGTPEGDPYRIPMLMVEMMLREAGWRVSALGSSLPFDTLAAAVERLRPRLFFLSVSHVDDAESFVAGYERFYERASEAMVAVVVGGQGLREEIRERMRFAAYCENLARLGEFVATLDTGTVEPAASLDSGLPLAGDLSGGDPPGGQA
jgi:excisionase family DNA binding protein